jgi:hypothetical protein
MESIVECATTMRVLSGTSTLTVSNDYQQIADLSVKPQSRHYQDNKVVWVEDIDLPQSTIRYSFFQRLADNSLCAQSSECSNAAIASYIYALNHQKALRDRPVRLVNANADSAWIVSLKHKHKISHPQKAISIAKQMEGNQVSNFTPKSESLCNGTVIVEGVEIYAFNKVYLFELTPLIEAGYSVTQIKAWMMELSRSKSGWKILGYSLTGDLLQTLMAFRGESHRSFPISSLYLLACYLEFHTHYRFVGEYRCRNLFNGHEFMIEFSGDQHKWLQTTVYTNIMEIN